VQPAPLLELFPGISLAEMTSYGPVEREAVYLLTRSHAARLPLVPPPMHNKGNHVFSLARLGRFMAERAEELGVMVLPETDAQRLLVTGGAVRGIRTGDKGRGRQGEELGEEARQRAFGEKREDVEDGGDEESLHHSRYGRVSGALQRVPRILSQKYLPLLAGDLAREG
jgi:hypothetical protein